MSLGIYVVSHKEYKFPNTKEYIPIKVGISKDDFAILSDSNGDNISDKNPYYCELTALYWLWKNRQLEDYVGFCHYRRYFMLKGNDGYLRKCVDNIQKNEDLINPSSVEKMFKKYDIIVPMAEPFLESMEDNYLRQHRKEDWEILIKVLNSKLDINKRRILHKLIHRRYGYICNMFISNKRIFTDYMEWLFDVLSEVEKHVCVDKTDKYQRRVFGFMAERLLNVYIAINNLRVIEVPMVYVKEDGENINDCYVDFKYKMARKFPLDLYWLKKILKRG